MTQSPRSTVEFQTDGLTITALTTEPAPPSLAPDSPRPDSPRPLIAALHGGTYTSRYFDVAGSPEGSFMDTAAASGYQVVSFDRPNSGGKPPRSPRPPGASRRAACCSWATRSAA